MKAAKRAADILSLQETQADLRTLSKLDSGKEASADSKFKFGESAKTSESTDRRTSCTRMK